MKSTNQLRLYYKWVQIIGDELGYFKDDMDDLLRKKLDAPGVFYKDLGGLDCFRYSLSNADKKQMSDYMDRVSIFAGSELGIMLPHPEDSQRNY